MRPADLEGDSDRVDCDFCRIGSGSSDTEEVLRTDAAVGFFPRHPAAVGHTLIIPREHVPDIWELESGLAGALAEASLAVAHAIRSVLDPDGLSVIQSNGAVASQTVMHLHIHLVPRWEGDRLPSIWPPRTAMSEERLRSVGSAIRRNLKLMR